METLKQYAPWIIGAIVIIYVVRKMTTRTSLLPQTQLTQTPQPDAYAEARSKAFESLIGLGTAQIAGDVQQARIASEERVSLTAIGANERIGQLQALERNQDRQVQQSAIDRYYSSRNTGTILNSINQALGSIFSNRNGGNVFGTPPIFNDFGGF